MKNILIAAGAAAALSLGSVAHANDANYRLNHDPATDGVFGSITDDFRGNAVLSKTCGIFPINANCTFDVTGTIADGGNHDLVLTITDATSSGNLICNGITFNNFNWTSSPIDNSLLPTSPSDTSDVEFEVNGIQVATSCGNCAGSVTATFSNANNGAFAFDGTLAYTGGGLSGDCSVAGSDISAADGTAYSVWHVAH